MLSGTQYPPAKAGGSALRNRHKIILHLENGMAIITIFHNRAPLYVAIISIADKYDRLKAVILTFNRYE